MSRPDIIIIKINKDHVKLKIIKNLNNNTSRLVQYHLNKNLKNQYKIKVYKSFISGI